MTKPRNRRQVSLRLALAIIAFIAIGMRWWQTVPNRTVSKFAEAIVGRDAETLAALCPSRDALAETWRLDEEPASVYKMGNKPRALQDVVFGRSSYEITFHDGAGQKLDAVRVDVLRFGVENVYSAMPTFATMIAAHNSPTRADNEAMTAIRSRPGWLASLGHVDFAPR